jgi:hypothetical protein
MTEPVGPHAISVEGSAELTSESSEVARVWVTDNAGSTIWVNASILEDPKVFGFLMADTIRSGARVYATTLGIAEDEALQAIVNGIAEDLRDEFGNLMKEGKPG